MATLEQLSAALVKADAAGNAADAKAFADEIRRMRAATKQDPAAVKEPESALSFIGSEAKSSLQNIGNLVAGGVRGAASIGTTLRAPADMLDDYLMGDGRNRSQERRAALDPALQSMGADPDSMMYQGGKIGGEIAGVAGVGPALGAMAKAGGAAPSIANALTTGGFKAGANPGALNMLTRIGGGAATGAASAGMIDPEYAKTGAVVGGALPPALMGAGHVGGRVTDGLKDASNRLMQSAIKPTIKELKTGDAAIAVRTLLDNGINPTKGGVNKLRALIGDIDDQISAKIADSTATVSKGGVLDAAWPTRAKFANQVDPIPDLNAIDSVAERFYFHPKLPTDAIPVQVAQDLKQGTYKALSKKYGQLGSADTEAQKALARGLKEGIAEAVPGIQGLNAQESKLITTLKVAERRALMELNKNPVGLASLAGNPYTWAVFMADKSALFKSLTARMLNSGVNKAQSTAPALGHTVNPLLRSAPAVSAGLVE